MKPQYSFISGKVALRVFLLFFVASLTPIVVLGYLSFYDVSNKLLEQNKQQLQQISSSAGRTISDRLDNLHHQLNTLVSRYQELVATNKPIEQFEIDNELRNSFSAIVISSNDNKYMPLYNGVDEFPNLSQRQVDHLQNGNALLIFSDYSRFQKKLLMIISLDPTASNSGFIIAEINQKYLWNFDEIIHNPIFGCISTETHETLYCTSSNIRREYLIDALTKNRESSATFEWKENNTDFIAFYWTVFLEGKYSTNPWLVILSIPKNQDKTALESIRSIYPSVITLSLSLVLLLSFIQLRHNLGPLKKLMHATKQVATGDFSSRVAIATDNELKDLSDSFNNMAIRLDKQFKSLSTMADIDRIILSATNKDYVVDTVLKRFMDIVSCDYVLLTLLDSDILNSSENKTNKLNESIYKSFVKIDDEDARLLLAHPKFLTITSMQHAPKYAKEIVHQGVQSLVVYPITIGSHLQAIITLGFKGSNQLHKDDLARGREMVDRIAVALSNATKEEKIYEQANYDSLTKLPNRTLLIDRLNQAIQRARRDGTQIATILVDLDRFKTINDSLGHSAGDQLLVEVSTRLSSVISNTDTLGRLSGDEFLVILSDIDYSNNSTSVIASTVESIINAIKYPFIIHAHEVNVSASIGISMYPADTKETEDLLRFAEIAMYHAKSKLKGAYQFYSKEINASSVAHLVLENHLRQAIQNNELELHYQPLLDRNSGKIVAAEALLRWHHPELGNIAPNRFLPIADSSGLIVPLGDWALRKACGQIRQWLDQGITPPRIAINLSAHQFREQNLIKRVKQILKEQDVDVSYLELEITEDTIMNDIDKTSITLRTLNDMGIRLAVDDFGTGYSSLNYLAKFPIQYLKIDQSFIKDVTHDPNMASIITAIIALAHSLRLQVIAEGIETQEQYEFLDRLQCDILQGHLISVPLPPDNFVDVYLKHNAKFGENRQTR